MGKASASSPAPPHTPYTSRVSGASSCAPQILATIGMGRRKVQIRRIEDDRARKVTFAKRKHGLVKKAMELSLLCDCDIALLIFTREKPDQRFYKYTTTNINTILQKLSKNPPVVEDRHNGMYEQLYVKKGKGGDTDPEDALPPQRMPTAGIPMMPNTGLPSMPGMPGMPGLPGMPMGVAGGMPSMMQNMGEDMALAMGQSGSAAHKKNLSVEIPGGGDLAQLGDLNTPNSLALFNQLGSSVMANNMQLSPNAISLGSLGSGSGIGGGMNFPSPNTLAAFGNMVSGNTPRGAVPGNSFPIPAPVDAKALPAIPEKK